MKPASERSAWSQYSDNGGASGDSRAAKTSRSDAVSEARRGLNLFRHRVEKAAVQSAIKRHPQFAMIVVIQRNEAEGLHTGALKLAGRLQHFGHAADGARTGMERDFHEISGGELLRQLQ